MARRANPYGIQTDEIEGYGAGTWAGNIGTGAMSGAATGMTLGGGPWGAVAGGLIGGVAGGVATGADEKDYKAAQEQQNQLKQDLGSRDVYDNLIAQQGIRDSIQMEAAQTEAAQAGNRYNLTGASTAALQAKAARDLQLQSSLERGQLYLTAQQMDQARRDQVLQEYGASQELANNATASAGQNMASLGQAMGAAAQLGTMMKSSNAIPSVDSAPVAGQDMGLSSMGNDLMALPGSDRTGTAAVPGAGMDPEAATRMQAVSLQAKANPTILASMQGLSPQEQVAMGKAYPEAFGGTYVAPPVEQNSLGGTPYENPYVTAPTIGRDVGVSTSPVASGAAGAAGAGSRSGSGNSRTGRAPTRVGTGPTGVGAVPPVVGYKGAPSAGNGPPVSGATPPTGIQEDTHVAVANQDAEALLSRTNEYQYYPTSEQEDTTVSNSGTAVTSGTAVDPYENRFTDPVANVMSGGGFGAAYRGFREATSNPTVDAIRSDTIDIPNPLTAITDARMAARQNSIVFPEFNPEGPPASTATPSETMVMDDYVYQPPLQPSDPESQRQALDAGMVQGSFRAGQMADRREKTRTQEAKQKEALQTGRDEARSQATVQGAEEAAVLADSREAAKAGDRRELATAGRQAAGLDAADKKLASNTAKASLPEKQSIFRDSYSKWKKLMTSRGVDESELTTENYIDFLAEAEGPN